MGSSSGDDADAASGPSIVLSDRTASTASAGSDAVAASSDAGSLPPTINSNDDSESDAFFSSLAGLALPDLFV